MIIHDHSWSFMIILSIGDYHYYLSWIYPVLEWSIILYMTIGMIYHTIHDHWIVYHTIHDHYLSCIGDDYHPMGDSMGNRLWIPLSWLGRWSHVPTSPGGPAASRRGGITWSSHWITLWWTNIAMERSTIFNGKNWENPLFQWSFSIAFCMFTRG